MRSSDGYADDGSGREKDTEGVSSSSLASAEDPGAKDEDVDVRTGGPATVVAAVMLVCEETAVEPLSVRERTRNGFTRCAACGGFQELRAKGFGLVWKSHCVTRPARGGVRCRVLSEEVVVGGRVSRGVVGG